VNKKEEAKKLKAELLELYQKQSETIGRINVVRGRLAYLNELKMKNKKVSTLSQFRKL
jgi:hypothetical protein